jgi:hypothetical protein
VDVALLYFDDCPNWREVEAHLFELAAEIPGLRVVRRTVDTPEEAERVAFRGSPSMVVDGVDLFAEADDPVGLSCRVYQTPDGPAGSPTLEQLRPPVAGPAAVYQPDRPITSIGRCGGLVSEYRQAA